MASFEDILVQCPTIADDTNYWFVRTEGGTLYEAFLASNSIALNYSKFGLESINACMAKSEEGEKKKGRTTKKDKGHSLLRALVKKNYPSHTQPGLVANQILRFCRVMKKGDFIVCPSFSTSKLLLGMINDDAPFEDELVVDKVSYADFKLRRKVKWVRAVKREEVNPKLFAVLLTHQALVSANNYATWIDPLFYTFFRKRSHVHYVMEVGTNERIQARTLFGACAGLLAMTDEIAESQDLAQDTASIDTRINLNSPGVIEFICANPAVSLAALATIVNLLVGGGLRIKIGPVNINLGAHDGLIQRVNQCFNSMADREMKAQLTSKLKELDVKESGQFVAILDAVDDLRKKGKK